MGRSVSTRLRNVTLVGLVLLDLFLANASFADLEIQAPSKGGLDCLIQETSYRFTGAAELVSGEPRPFETALHFRRQGLFEKANVAEDAVVGQLETQSVLKLDRVQVHQGINDSSTRVMRLGNGISAIAKLDGIHEDTGAEVAAYQVSRRLGLNLVPVTVRRFIPKNLEPSFSGYLSLQYFVKEAQPAHKVLGWRTHPEVKTLRFLDFLINNTDRHENNVIFKNGKMFAIDHGLAFQTRTVGKSLSTLSDLEFADYLPKPDAVKKLLEFDPPTVHHAFKDLLEGYQIRAFLANRREFLLTLYFWQRKGHFRDLPLIRLRDVRE